MAVFVSDQFTGTGFQNLDIGRVATVGGKWERNGATPDTRWYLIDNRVECGDVTGAVYSNGVPGSANYSVECDYTIFSDIQGAGIAVRMSTSALTFYGVRYQGGQYVLSKYVNGVEAWVGTPYVVNHVGQTHKLKIRVSGTSTTTVIVSIDGVDVITYADSSSPITAAGKAGMYSLYGSNDAGTGKHIDNFVADDGVAASAVRSRAIWIVG